MNYVSDVRWTISISETKILSRKRQPGKRKDRWRNDTNESLVVVWKWQIGMYVEEKGILGVRGRTEGDAMAQWRPRRLSSLANYVNLSSNKTKTEHLLMSATYVPCYDAKPLKTFWREPGLARKKMQADDRMLKSSSRGEDACQWRLWANKCNYGSRKLTLANRRRHNLTR